VKSDFRFPYCGPVFFILTFLFHLYVRPHYNKYKHAYFKLKFSGNVSSVLVSYVFADVYFLHFGELNM